MKKIQPDKINFMFKHSPYYLLFTVFHLIITVNGVNAQFNKAYFFYKGEELISKGEYAEAIPMLNTLLNVDSTIHEAWFLRGVARYYQGDMIGAQKDFHRCLKVNPLFSQAYQYNAMVFEQMGQTDQAIENIKKAIELRPNSAQYLFTYGVILFQQERYADALSAFNQVIRIDERIPDAWLNRGATKLMLTDSTGALNDYTTAINLNPFSANPYVRRGSLYAQQKKYPLAINDLNMAISIDSLLPQAYFTRALIHYYQKQLNQSLIDLNKVLQLDSRNTLALFNRAIINYEIGNQERAIDDLTRLASIIPTNVLVHYYLASIRFERGYLKTALDNINKAIDLFPQFANAYLLRAEIKSQMGDLKGSESDFTQGNKLAQEFRGKASSDITSIIDSAGKLKRLLSLDEELDIASSISMELLRTRMLTIVYPVITLKIDATQNVKPQNWQSSNIRQKLESVSCGNFTLYFDYASIEQQSKTLHPDTDSLTAICAVVTNLQQNQYKMAMEQLIPMVMADSTNSLLKLTEVLARIQMVHFVENIKNDNLQNSTRNREQMQSVNETLNTAANDLKIIAKSNEFEGIVPYNIGVLSMQTGHNDEAVEWFTRAIELNQQLHGAWYNRGLLFLIKNETTKGCSDLRKAVDLGNNQASEVVARFCTK